MYNLIYEELMHDIEDLKNKWNFTEEEIEGYIEFFFDDYFFIKGVNDVAN